jgi:uncharacterized protein
VHPESYPTAKALLARFGYTDDDVREGKLGELRLKISKYGAKRLADELGCGEPTLVDIVTELEKPGRDIRDAAPAPHLRTDVLDIKDLKEGMILTGTVRNVADFGAFVDIGVHHDGLLHISEMCDRYIKHPSEVLSVGDIVEVRIKSVDVARSRIGLSRKNMNKG